MGNAGRRANNIGHGHKNICCIVGLMCLPVCHNSACLFNIYHIAWGSCREEAYTVVVIEVVMLCLSVSATLIWLLLLIVYAAQDSPSFELTVNYPVMGVHTSVVLVCVCPLIWICWPARSINGRPIFGCSNAHIYCNPSPNFILF